MPQSAVPQSLWNDREASQLTGLSLLAYRSRLLASDRSVINIYGGNTSSKVTEVDHLGRETRVLWVKGSGSDMADCSCESFAGLKLDEVLPLMKREDMSDEEMVEYLGRCVFEPGRPRQSIETLLHAFLPYDEVDHTHPDSIIALACTARGRDAAVEVFGDRAAWVDYIRPGFRLSRLIADAVASNPRAECVVMGKHGLVCWGDTAKESYERTIRIISEAEDAIRESEKKVWAADFAQPSMAAIEFLPELRGAVSKQRKQIVLVDQSDRVLSMVNSPRAKDLSQIGAACPDHLVHVKPFPLYWDPTAGQIGDAVEEYRRRYEEYFAAHAEASDVMFDPAPRVVLIPGFGLAAVGKDAQLADVSRQLYHRAVEVIEGAEALGGFESLSHRECFAIEYWPLELYKLKQRPPDKELAGHIALVTGGASGIGRATALRLAEQGAHVCVADINFDRAQDAAGEIQKKWGLMRSVAAQCDVTSESDVARTVETCVLTWGGLDVTVCSAGIASSAPVEETTEAEWQRNFDVLAKGYFLFAKESFKVWRRQGTGGSLVFVTSKNAVAAGKNASAYSAAKAAEQHLARCLAEEGGALGVRVNCVMPDAVLSGSSIWDGEWRRQRAEAYGIRPEDLEEFYRNRTTLKRNVLPEDIAEAVLFFASDRSAKTTGAALTVDAGVPAAYLR